MCVIEVKFIIIIIKFIFVARRRSDVSQTLFEKETKILQELESAVFNEFRKGVRKKIRRHSRSRQTYPYHINTQAASPPQRKAVSERPKKSKTRSRLRKQIAEEDSDNDGQPQQRTRRKNNLNLSDIPVISAPESMESTTTLTWSRENVLDEKHHGAPFSSTPDNKQSSLQPQHKVKFSSSATELSESGSSTSKTSTLTQQNLDFELDIMVNIDSGKCVFHLTTDDDENTDNK